MTDFLTEIPRWVTNLAFWIALLTMLACTWGVQRSFKGSRNDLDKALDELYSTLDALKAVEAALVREKNHPVRALSASVPPPDNVRDIPTTKTAVARTDEAVEGLKATLGMPTDPNRLTAVGEHPTVVGVPTASGLDVSVPSTNAIPAARPDDPGRIASNVHPSGWAYVLAPDHKIEQVDGHAIPAFRDPEDTPTPDQLIAPTNPDLAAQPGQRLAGATKLDPGAIGYVTVGGRHRHPEDDA